VPEFAVAFTVSGQREKYLRQALDSWTRVRGVDDWHLVFCVEPAPRFPVRDFSWWAADQFHSVSVVANPRVLGCLANTRQAFEAGFSAGARFTVMAEEDLEVASDTLEYFAWAEEAYRDDQGVMAVCGHAKAAAWPAPAADVVRASWFSPLVCGTWAGRWESFIRPRWKGHTGSVWDGLDSQAWDTSLRWEIREAGRSSIFPVRSRALHIGEFSTWLAPAVAEYLYADTQSTCFSADNLPQSYREVAFDSVPGLLV
jgi:hypothetical protein